MTDGICGYTRIGATGIEWICVAKPHSLTDPEPGVVLPEFLVRKQSITEIETSLRGARAIGPDNHFMRPRWGA